MNPNKEESARGGVLDRLRKSWFPPSAVVGAFAAFVAAALRVRPTPSSAVAPKPAAEGAGQRIQPAAPTRTFERTYRQASVVAPVSSAYSFRRSLLGITVTAEDHIYALGDDEVRVFNSNGDWVRSWNVAAAAQCIAVGPDGRVYIGYPGRVEIYDRVGKHLGGFAAGATDRPADITAVKIYRQEILVADAASRYIRRYDSNGRQIGEIGTQNKTRTFILPNRSLDIDVDSTGTVLATDTGRHRVSSWAIDGSPRGHFGKFGQTNPEDFVGCCNPVNLAFTPDGEIVTAEKAMARVKVYEPGGKLLAMIGPENFDPNCTHLHLAVDSKKRILVADPVRRIIKIFSPRA